MLSRNRGVASSVSLPIGALLGIYLKVSRRVNSALLAFGAGALLFAITIELYGHAICEHENSGSDDKLPMILLAVGSLIGSALFSGTNYVIEHQSNLKSKIIIKPTLMLASARSNLSKFGRRTSSFNVSSLDLSFKTPVGPIPDDDEGPYSSNSNVLRFRIDDDEDDDEDDDPAQAEVEVDAHLIGDGDAADPASYGAIDDFAETVPLKDAPAQSPARPGPPLSLGYQASAMATKPAAGAGSNHVAFQTDASGSLSADGDLGAGAAGEGAADAEPHTPGADSTVSHEGGHGGKKRRNSVTSVESHDPAHDQQVGVAIWLGLLIDSLPESLVIGILATAEGGISITFILGVFLSNLPEALSSTVIMRRAGLGKVRIMIMWTSIMVITGIGAFIGAIAFRGDVSDELTEGGWGEKARIGAKTGSTRTRAGLERSERSLPSLTLAVRDCADARTANRC